MKKYDQQFVAEMREKLDVELLGAAAISESASALLREQAQALLPGALSVFVFAMEMYREVVSLLWPSKEAGEAE